jgi:hypothetical protein
MFRRIKKKGCQVLALHHHAEAILEHDVGSAVDEIESVLLDVTMRWSGARAYT